MKLAFLVLAHDHPDNLLRLVNYLTEEGDSVIVHWDRKSSLDIAEYLREKMADDGFRRVRFAKRHHVEWGMWSMVEATLSCIEELERSGMPADYVCLLSGADYPLRPLSHLKVFLKRQPGHEYIECVDPKIKRWVIRGLSIERYSYRHWVSWRKWPKLFDFFFHLQRRLGLKRRPPKGLKVYFGSQWWALTSKTAKDVLARSRDPKIRRFFKYTNVPDEMFFQTIAASLVPIEKIGPMGLTFYHFTSEGKPIVFYNDHLDFLLQQNFFFARKISPWADKLRDGLDEAIKRSALYSPNGLVLRKDLDRYDRFIWVQSRGIPNIRVIGQIKDSWYGDLEWNRMPYFVILAPDRADLTLLRSNLNANPRIRCYGELFHPDYIDYSVPGGAHPSYPKHASHLRDLKRPNFLCDLIHWNADKIVGLVMRVPPHHEMVDVVIFDQRATIIICLPESNAIRNTWRSTEWSPLYDAMVMNDRLSQIKQAGKIPITLTLKNNSVSGHAARKAAEIVASQFEEHEIA